MSKFYRLEFATPECASEVYEFLHPHGQIHPDLSKDAFIGCWRHQFFGGGKPGYVLLARDKNGQVGAHYGIMPMRYRVRGSAVTAGFACQLFVRPDLRSTPLFFELERRLLTEHREFGFDFLYSLVTIKPVLAAHLSLGFARGHDLSIWAFPILPGRLASAARLRFPDRLKPAVDALGKGAAQAVSFWGAMDTRGIEVAELASGSQLDETLLERVQSAWHIGAERSRRAIEDRIAGFGGKRYTLVAARSAGGDRGYMITRRTRIQGFDAMVVIDLLAPEGDRRTVEALLAWARQAGLKGGSAVVVCLCGSGAWFASSLTNGFFFRTPAHFTLVCDRANRGMLDSLHADSWHLSWFDHDYV